MVLAALTRPGIHPYAQLYLLYGLWRISQQLADPNMPPLEEPDATFLDDVVNAAIEESEEVEDAIEESRQNQRSAPSELGW